jgi:hypothetical protein
LLEKVVGGSMSKVISFDKKRKENIEKKKRSIERLMLNDFLGCSSVIDDQGTHYQVKLIDISHDGCLIQVPKKDGAHHLFDEDNEITLRFYFTDSSYVPVNVTVKHHSDFQEAGKKVDRIGCQFDKTTASWEVMERFIEFLYSFAELSVIDKGDNKVYFL